ncbi:FAD-dependent oxidoreductase [Nocardia stercoris]|uniref:Pentachlorophenol monooxygenase n=1 Tax=Nocardia stercoris TaxID=2483361 RepID=A0A3M2L1Y9_9NOCA|nr:FAD-dependent monooxygenase [Nocardia stercoris]RMI31667.1 pentachlorophenol monooxygenase [Nocardia stercoris]
MTTVPTTASVVVVGAGPVGLTAGIALADAGVDVVVLDRQAEGANTSRAVVIHARTLEVLDTFGVTAQLRDQGLIVPTFVALDGDRELARVSFGDLPTEFPYTVMVGQEVTESILLARLRAAGGDVLRPYAVASLTQDESGVTVGYTGPDGTAGSIRADYVIGADGMYSTVRDAVGIGFEGAQYPESFVLADVRMAWPAPRDEVSLNLSPEGFMLVAPLPNEQHDRYRIVAQVAEAPEKPDLAAVQAILDERRPAGGGEVREVLWSSRFRVHHRLATSYRAGRVFVAGDAAHVHSPAGGQGMNTGIQDAAYLGGLLAQVTRGADPALLDDYETTRRPVAESVVAMTDRMTKMATLSAAPARAVRNLVLSTVTRIPAVREKLAFVLSELGYR